METGSVYKATTEPQPKPSRCLCGCTLRHLLGWRLPLKAFQVIFSLLAFICEEIVEDCITCGGLYFFEFTSFSAFFLSLLILYMYCTDTYEIFGEDTVKRVNFGAVIAICLFFLLASIVFAATGTGSTVEKAALAFGFLAFVAFLAEILAESFYSYKQNVNGRSENPGNTQSATENQPLNKAS